MKEATSRVLFLVFSACLLFLPSEQANSQDIDSFFDDPDSGIIEDEATSDDATGADSASEDGEPAGEDTGSEDETENAEEEEAGVDIAALTTSPTQFSGSVSSNAGIALGLEEWPGTDAAGGRDISQLRRASGVYDMSATFNVDSRPKPYLRFRGSVKTNLNENNMTFSGLGINELFVDYTLLNTIFFRAGKQGLTWGQGRLFKNPANLVDRVSGGIALRASAPLGPGSINGVTYSLGRWVQDYRSGSPRAFAYAGLYEATVGPLTFEVSGHYKADELVGNAASVSFGLGPIDFTFEGMGKWDSENPTAGLAEQGALAQLYWESSDASWTALGEYEYDSTVPGGKGHYAGLGFQTPKFGRGGWRPGLRWLHAFQDDSGEISAGVSGTIAPNLTASIGIPVVYGEPGSYFRALEDDETGIPVEDVVSLLVAIELGFSF